MTSLFISSPRLLAKANRALPRAVLAACIAWLSLPIQAQNLAITNRLQLWLKADAGVAANAAGAVTAWADQSGQANHAAQPDEAAAPKLVQGVLNNKPVIRFDGDNDFLDVATATSLEIVGDIASYFVVKFDDYATYRAVWGKTAVNIPASTDYYLLPSSGIVRAYRGSGVVSDIGSVDSSTGIRAGTYVVLGFEMAGTRLTHFLNGQDVGSGNITATLVDGGTALKIGSRDDLFTKMKGDIAELLIFDAALSANERASVVSYLQTKYGIVNQPPNINLTSPSNNATITAPANLNVTASVADTDGLIAKVDFFANGSLIGTATASPFRVPVTIQSGGTVTFTATATDNKDAKATAAPVVVTATGGAAATLAVTSGLQLWLKADAGVTKDASGAVTAWSDQSGKNNHAAQPDFALAPLWMDATINGKPALRFDGTDDYLDVASSDSVAITGDVASFFVVKFDDFATYRAVWGKTASNVPRPTDYYLLPNSGVPRVYRGSDDGNRNAFVDGGRVAAGAYAVLGFSQGGTLMTHYFNGQLSGSGQMVVTPTDSGTTLRIGSRDDLVTKMKGDIAELLVYNRDVSGDDQRALAAYLGAKYGIPIVQPANRPPTVALAGLSAAAILNTPTNITLSATASDADGSVVKVEFLANGSVIGTATASPFRASLSLVAAGGVTLSAVATDNLGAKTTSATIAVTVNTAVSSPLPATDALKLWLKADAGVTANASGAVTAWTDHSTGYNSAFQTDVSAAPQLIANAVNGKPALRFDGANDYLEVAHSPSLAITGDISSFFVVKFDDFATFRAVWAKTAANLPRPTDYYVLPNAGTPRVFRGGPAGIGNVDATEPIPAGEYVVLGFDMTATTLTHYLNGLVIGTGEITAVPVDLGNPLRIGTRGDFVTRMKGDIAEIIIYNSALGETDRNKVVDYLTTKYLKPGVAAPQFTAIRRQANNVVLEWNAAAGVTLEEAVEITGPWTSVAVTGNSHAAATTAQRKFYRLKR
ncbi:MAG: hypothetical protein HYY23_17655 [Verrucomicrobia bacterium]|nr:hypothetical protein [Verrucomicrobiota bacterium]